MIRKPPEAARSGAARSGGRVAEIVIGLKYPVFYGMDMGIGMGVGTGRRALGPCAPCMPWRRREGRSNRIATRPKACYPWRIIQSPGHPMSNPQISSRAWVMLIALAAIWAFSYLFMQWGVDELPVMTVVFGRVAVAALLLVVLVYATGKRLPASATIESILLRK